MNGWTKRTAIGIAVAHTLLLAAYTMPAQVVPVRMRYWSQAYARVLFHQDWRLFAPDPPDCGCTIEFRDLPDGAWMTMGDLHRGFIWKRMAANACRYAEASVSEDGVVRMYDSMERSLVDMTGHDPFLDGSTFRLRRGCGGEPEEITEIRLSQRGR